MSAEVLREAARLMRERAQAIEGWYTAAAWSTTAPMNLPIDKADAEHIASWHPVVALAVADELDAMAAVVEEAADGPLALVAAGLAEKSLSVARAYLGEQVTP